MPKSKFFLLVSVIFLLAIAASCFFAVEDFHNFLADKILLVFLLGIFCLFLSFWQRNFFILFIIVLVILRIYYFTQAEYDAKSFVYNKNYSLLARVVDRDKKIDSWRYVVMDQNQKVPNRIILNAPLYPEYKINDLWQLDCYLVAPKPIANDNENIFYYDKYLAKDKIFYNCLKPKIKKIGQVYSWDNFINNSRNYFIKNLNALPEPEGAFAKAIILGNQKEVPNNLAQAFSRTGLVHIISISGLHMVIVIWLIYALLGFLGLSRQRAFIFLALGLFAYLYLIGFISPALRSSAMILLALFGPIIKRQTFSLYSVVFLADIFVLANPYLLLFDISFQLSFLAVLGLIFYTNYFKYFFRKIPQIFNSREVLAVTLAAQMFTWPVTAYYFANISLVAGLANFLALPLFPAILVLTLLLAIFGVMPFLKIIFLWPLDILLRLLFKIIDYLAVFKYAAISIRGFDWQFLLLSFLITIMITILIKPTKYEAPD